jgi:hypothetical protein
VPPAPAKKEANVAGAVFSSAEWVIMIGLGGGLLLASALVWWLWRGKRELVNTATAPTTNLFSGLGLGHAPTPAELASWPVERVRALAQGIFEETGYRPAPREGTEAEFTLATAGDAKPAVLVSCWSGTGGPAHAKALRALSGTLVADEFTQGWFVSPSGFYDEARAVAQERGIVLIEGAALLARLKELPALGLRRVLARAGASRAEA